MSLYGRTDLITILVKGDAAAAIAATAARSLPVIINGTDCYSHTTAYIDASESARATLMAWFVSGGIAVDGIGFPDGELLWFSSPPLPPLPQD